MINHHSFWTASALALLLNSGASILVDSITSTGVQAAEKSLSPEARLAIRKEQEDRLARLDISHRIKMEMLSKQYKAAADLAAKQGEDPTPLLEAATFFQQQADKSSMLKAQFSDLPANLKYSHTHSHSPSSGHSHLRPNWLTQDNYNSRQLENLSNQISALSIIIDSNREGWEDVVRYARDPAEDNGDIGRTDWNTVSLAHDCDSLYVRYQVNDGPAFELDGKHYNLLVDVDNNPMTGYRGLDNWLSIGADVLIQGGSDGVTTLQYTGDVEQEVWHWQPINVYPVSDKALTDGGRDIDYRINISDLDVFANGVTDFGWVAWSDYATGIQDVYPDKGNLGDTGDFNTYTFKYKPTTEGLTNPERGFVRATQTDSSKHAPLDLATLQCYRQNEGINLIHRIYYLENFIDSDISQEYLDLMQADFDMIRQAGLKMTLRFAYTAELSLIPPYGDPSKDRMLSHLNQLSNILIDNSDVIAVVQAGFIGLKREWQFSDHFQLDGDWNDRAQVLFKLLGILPTSRTVQLSTPYSKQILYGNAPPLDRITAHDASDRARTGYHNNCFVSSMSDDYTFVGGTTEQDYVEKETMWVPMGGETCDPNLLNHSEPTRLTCATAIDELSRFHFSFLKLDRIKPALRKWLDEGCLSEIEKRLGYRLILEQGRYDDLVTPGDKFQFTLQLKNEGFSAPFNPRVVELIFRHSDGSSFKHALADDPRYWLPGEIHTITDAISIPENLSPGEYELLLNLPAPEPALYQRPEYSIRLANENIWEPKTGYNRLNHQVFVQPSAYYPEVIDVSVGEPDWGSLHSFKTVGEDTYDIKANTVTGGKATDWYATTTISVPPVKVSQLTLTHKGKYSKKKVDQEIYLYNYKSASWDLIDRRILANTDDVTVRVTLFNPHDYFAVNGTSSVRVRGFREKKQQFYAWANYLSWEVQ